MVTETKAGAHVAYDVEFDGAPGWNELVEWLDRNDLPEAFALSIRGRLLPPFRSRADRTWFLLGLDVASDALADLDRVQALRVAEEAYLRDAGWLPADHPDACDGDWTPPEDRENLWDFERAMAEQRKRDAAGDR